MRRVVVFAAVALVGAVAAPTASPGGLVPAASTNCAGILAAAANPNNGYVLHNLVKPALDAQGMTLGELQRGLAQQHPGVGGVDGLEACIPDL